MAITSTLIGSLGASKVTESRFWFSNSRRYCSDLNKDWTVEQGDYLFTWQGVPNRSISNSTISLNGVSMPVGGSKEYSASGWAILRNVTDVAARGTGDQGFAEDPIVQYVKIA